jgi:hypothetical protein
MVDGNRFVLLDEARTPIGDFGGDRPSWTAR